ncbi:putative glycerol-3-phosphate acyltransferase PlsX [Neisseria gonorrhoeae]|uniref:phosphate acyltransferase n=1 Tax=Neisseria gonorrhoeae TaxID=485 RepID=A0A378W0G4_NEIGO|nr:putative glycerol-3-phosphate acyltransferase PlsX [Neisseria gonorrhoeae]
MSGAIRREFQSNLFNKLAAVAALPALKGLKNKLDPRKFNGAILLGLRGIVIKSHGGTDKPVSATHSKKPTTKPSPPAFPKSNKALPNNSPHWKPPKTKPPPVCNTHDAV